MAKIAGQNPAQAFPICCAILDLIADAWPSSGTWKFYRALNGPKRWSRPGIATKLCSSSAAANVTLRSCMTSRISAFFLVLYLLSAVPAALYAQQEIRPPLHTSGYDVLDAAGHRVRLTSVNWYGFDQKEFVAGGLDVA